MKTRKTSQQSLQFKPPPTNMFQFAVLNWYAVLKSRSSLKLSALQCWRQVNNSKVVLFHIILQISKKRNNIPGTTRGVDGRVFQLAELTGRVDGPSTRLVEMRAHQHGPCGRVMETGHPSTRAVNSGSGNRA